MKSSVRDQVDSGIQVISDGQTRKGMIELFADGLVGFRIKERCEIVSKVRHGDPITVPDQRFIRGLISDEIGLKGIITGPWTLVKNSVNQFYRSEKDAVMDISRALSKETERLSDICDIVQIDEPMFGINYPEYAEEELEILTGDTTIPTKLHVCGDVREIADKLVELNVDILDHEFTANPSLFETYQDIDFPQRMAVGVVSTEKELEEVEKIKERIKKAHDTFGTDSMIDPDCGLRNLDRWTAKKKLENIDKAKDAFLDEMD